MSNTRFEPSTNGGLHLGHIYIAMLNREIARQSGGKFLIRFDDAGDNLKVLGSSRIKGIRNQMLIDLSWMGLNGDVLEFNSRAWAEADEIIKSAGLRVPLEPAYYANYQQTPTWLAKPGLLIYPYTPTLTARKVVLDRLAGVDLLIRGEELMTELSLYCYYCDVLGYPRPTFVHVPRLRAGSSEMSKTLGNDQLADFRANGYSPDMIMEMLAIACLKNPANGWSLLNLKEAPCL